MIPSSTDRYSLPSLLHVRVYGLFSRLISDAGIAWITALLVALSWGPRLFRSFWVDEAGTFWMTHEGLRAAIEKAAHWPGQSILYAAIASFFTIEQGSFREPLLRVPTILAMAAACYFVYRLAEYGIGKKSGVIAVILFAFHPSMVIVGTQARPYGLAVAATLASCWYLYRWVEDRRVSSLIGYAVSSALIVYFHYLFAQIFAAQFIYLFFVLAIERRTSRIWQLAGAWLAIAVLVLPLIPYFRLLIREAHTLPYVAPPQPVELAEMLLPPIFALCALLFVWVIALVFPAALQRPAVRSRSFLLLLLSWWLAGPMLLFALSALHITQVFILRYMAGSLAVQPLLFAYGAFALFESRAARIWALATAMVGTAIPLLLIATRPGPEELIPAIKLIQAESQNGAPPVFFRSPLPESNYYDWRAGLGENSYLFAPFVAYPMKNRLLPLPYELDGSAHAYVDHLLATTLVGVPEFLYISHAGMGVPWMVQRMERAGYKAEIRQPNRYAVVIFRARKRG